MDGSDTSLAIRRARRSGAKRIDLSNRGLREWPEGLFSLRQLETLDISGNELSTIDPGIQQLDALEELNLANNRFEMLSDFDTLVMPKLCSLVLEGNPLVSRMGAPALRQLARPPTVLGQTPSQVIRNLIVTGSAEGGASGPVGAFRTSLSSPGVDDVTRVQAFNQDEVRSPHFSSAPLTAPLRQLPTQSDGADAWKRERMELQKEIDRLQTRTQELESQVHTKPAPAEDSSVPAWLRQGEGRKSLASTLPSRRAEADNTDQASGLKSLLQEEQRKTKRLEQQVQRLTERANEQGMKSNSVGSVPFFEFAEVEMGEQISQGGFSVVHKGTWNGTKVAIKKLFDPKINEELIAEFDNEVQKLEQVRHPNILLLLALHRKPPALSFITELVEGGSFFQFLHQTQSFNSAGGHLTSPPFQDTLDIMEYSGVALAYLHARGIAHRDMKSQNVLLTPNLEVKLCDFGLARMRSELMTGTMQFAGTPNYMAPEIFRNQKYTENVDVFAYGTTLWEALAVDIPWANFDAADIKDRVLAGRMLPMPPSATPDLAAVIQACWTGDRAARPGMAEALARFRTVIRGNAPPGGRRRPVN